MEARPRRIVPSSFAWEPAAVATAHAEVVAPAHTTTAGAGDEHSADGRADSSTPVVPQEERDLLQSMVIYTRTERVMTAKDAGYFPGFAIVGYYEAGSFGEVFK